MGAITVPLITKSSTFHLRLAFEAPLSPSAPSPSSLGAYGSHHLIFAEPLGQSPQLSALQLVPQPVAAPAS